MALEIVMPQLGLTMTEGSVARWHKQTGEPVEKGDLLFEVVTDKVDMDVESPASGVLVEILIEPERTVPVGTVIARLLEPGESYSPPPAKAETKLPMDKTPLEPPRTQARDTREIASLRPGKVRASPRARRLAESLNLDLAAIRGSGTGGRIVEADVRSAARSGTPKTGEVLVTSTETPSGPGPPLPMSPSPVFRLSGMRKLIAERMAQSFQTVPHFYLTVEVDCSNLLALRDNLVETVHKRAGFKITLTDLFIKALGISLSEHGEMNVRWEEGAIYSNNSVDIGLAVAVPEGLIVPVIRSADRLHLADLIAQRHDLTEKAHAGRLTLQELESASCTLSNLGMYGVDQFQAIINPPQSFIIAVGRVRERPYAVGSSLAVRSTMFMTLSVDHRITDGATAAKFLGRMVEIVEAPYRILWTDG